MNDKSAVVGEVDYHDQVAMRRSKLEELRQEVIF
jgi:hypothetical protein